MTTTPPSAASGGHSRTHRAAEEARKRLFRRRVVAVVLLVGLVGIAVLLLTGDGTPELPGADGGGVPGFGFELQGVRALSVTRSAQADVKTQADDAAEAVKSTMDRLYFGGFIDPAHWGAYEDVYELFDVRTAAAAANDVELLTLGSDARDTYDALAPTRATLRVTVLASGQDSFIAAVAKVGFDANARLAAGGGTTKITSSGYYFLRPTDNGWVITGYQVDREDESAGN